MKKTDRLLAVKLLPSKEWGIGRSRWLTLDNDCMAVFSSEREAVIAAKNYFQYGLHGSTARFFEVCPVVVMELVIGRQVVPWAG